MKKYFALFVQLFFLLCNGFAQQPLELWYQHPAEKWTDALPIGNGRLGAMIYGGIDQEQIQFNEETLWTGKPRPYQHKGAAAYLPKIRQLLFEGKQPEAEQLAEQHFMGLKDVDDSLYARQKSNWLHNVRKDTLAAAENYNDKAWVQMELPTLNGWETSGLQGLDGVVWFRNSFVLPDSWMGKDLVIYLGRIRDADFTYINGTLIGSEEGISTKRVYTIKASLLKPGLNSISVQVINYFDKGGFTGLKSGNDLFTIFPKQNGGNEVITLSPQWKYFVQNDNPPAFPQYQASYQPFGDLLFNFHHTGEISAYKRWLKLTDAVSGVSYQSGGIVYTREYFASAPANEIAFRFKAGKPGALNLDGGFNSLHQHFKTKKIDDHTLALYVQVKNGALRGVAYLHVICKGGTLKITDKEVQVKGATELTGYLTAATNFISYKDISGDPEKKCRQQTGYVKTKQYDFVKAIAIREYQNYFKRFSLLFNSGDKSAIPTDERIKQYTPEKDPGLVTLYVQYGRYLLISSSRPGTQPANLQGIWNDQLTPSWGSKYTTNINLEMNYWPSEPLNLSECSKPLFAMVKELAVTGSLTAKEHYNAPGWVLHHNTDLWRGTAPINASNHGVWVTGGAWLCHQVWEHYLFTKDDRFLRTYYPIIKSSAAFFNSVLLKDPVTGKLISSPSNSPEQGGLVAGPTMDHQIIRELFRHTIAASQILKLDPEFRKTLQQKLAEIAPNKIGKYGQLQEWMQDADDTTNTHRHVSHLWGVFPGTDINWQDSAMMLAARKSLYYRGDGGTGWSLAWKLNLYARFKEPDLAMGILSNLLSPAETASGSEQGGVYKNLFDAHPPFQIDGNFGGAAGVVEMLLQSQLETIELLPCLPRAWSTGSVKGIVARGGFLIDLSWKNGVLQNASIVSKKGNVCRIKYGGKTIKIYTKKGQRIRLNKYLKKI